MTGHPRPGVVLLVAAFALAGCGNASANPGEIATWSNPAGVSPDLVYVTDIDGFQLQVQSVGVSGDEGLSATYANLGSGGMVTLTTRRGPDATAPACGELSDDTATSGLRCWVADGSVTVVLEGQDGVRPATLRKAADAVHVPSKDEVKHLFSEVPAAPDEPVERGDLPEHGDGAPIDEPGPGG